MSKARISVKRTTQPQTMASPRKDWASLFSFGAGTSDLAGGYDYMTPLPAAGIRPGYGSASGMLFAVTDSATTTTKIVPGLTNKLTVVMVIDFISTTTANNFLFAESSPSVGSYNYGFYEDVSGNLRFFVHNGTTGVAANASIRASATRGIQIWVATYDGANIIMYRNGVQITSTAQTGNVQRSGTATISFQRWNAAGVNARFYAGAISTKAMSSQEIYQKFSTIEKTWGALFEDEMRVVPVSSGGNVTTTKTITGKSSIQATTTKTETGVARIQKTVTQTETGISRIQVVVPKTETGISRIQVVVPKTETGISRIQKSVAQTMTGVANITSSNITQSRTITGVSRITATATKTETGTARIQKITTQTETGVSRINATQTKTETGIARIQKSTAQTITAKAKIAGGVATLTPLSYVAVDLGGGVSKSVVSQGNLLEIEIVTSVPSSAPANGKGIVFYVSGGVVTIYVWDGSSWVAK